MELTTRCPECGTIFPVSLEQLQLRKGYIRCIQCAHIFDGFEAVVPAEAARGSASHPQNENMVEPILPRESAASRTPLDNDERPAHQGFYIPPVDSSHADAPQPARPFSIGLDRHAGHTEGTPAVGQHSISAQPSLGHAQADNEPRLPSVVRQRADMQGRSPRAAVSFTIPQPHAGMASEREQVHHEDTEPLMPSQPTTGDRARPGDDAPADDFLFVEPRVERRSDRYQPEFLADVRRPRAWVRPLWAVLILCGLVLLAIQGVYVYRAQLANSMPALRPVLESACERLGCTVPYERRIDAILIAASALRASGPPEGEVSNLTLEVTLRNVHDRPQEWPTLVLDIKDAAGVVVVRRNLPPDIWVPAELRQGPLAAGAEVKIELPVAVRGVRANGYQLDKFFP